jgi:synaptobrevin family protein YKT6
VLRRHHRRALLPLHPWQVCSHTPNTLHATPQHPTNTIPPTNSVREIGREINRTVAEATRPGTRQSKPEDQFTIHIYARSEGCAGIIVADQNYDKLVAHQLLSKILDEFTSKFPKSSWSNKAGLKTYQDGQTEGHLGWYIKEFQDPNNGDSIMKIQKELNETKETLQKAIQSTLERGEWASICKRRSGGGGGGGGATSGRCYALSTTAGAWSITLTIR